METGGQSTFTISTLKELFQKSADIIFHQYSFGQSTVYFIKCESMVDEQLLYTIVLPNIESLYKSEHVDETSIEQLPLPEIKRQTKEDEIITDVYSGNVLIYFTDCQLLYSSNIAKKPNRTPDETSMEVVVKGPRDNFIEDLATNIALIRKRLPTNSLCVEKLTLGKRSKTEVALLYFDDIVNKDILTELKKQLNKINTDVIISPSTLMEQVNKKNWFLPITNVTARPDFAIQSLSRGRFLVMVDGSSFAVITPINFFHLLKTAEDFEYPIVFTTFERILRLLGILIGVALPAFWLALTLFHQDQLPLQLLATVVISNRGLPFPAVLEMLLLLTMFELLREAGMRLPTKIGGTISVVGGIIIGDAAIRSGITSPAMVVIIALSTIASFTIANQSLVTIISIARIFFIIITAFLGLFGFFICIYACVFYLASIRVFGTPYFDITADLSWSSLKKSLFRLKKDKYGERPNMLDPQDSTRTNDTRGTEDDEG
ncbi:GerA spore germination protein [Ureibacillus xyleni]|uniref:GerA spore germination protein n=1 Tax=Ureibacillus xyleni TaxID=614648 RepID=A0A285T3L4_9BACL|nr:spore germination protein [Ureibacillus xyleni]SOC15906.1 GerA spore germination protein [Ureibacillus xyleni]